MFSFICVTHFEVFLKSQSFDNSFQKFVDSELIIRFVFDKGKNLHQKKSN